MSARCAFFVGSIYAVQLACAGEPPTAVLSRAPVEPPVSQLVRTAPTSAEATPYPFALVAYREGQIVLGHFDDQLVVAGAAAFARVEPDDTLSLLPGSIAGELPLHGLREIDMVWRTEAFGGRWPAEAWLVTRQIQWTAKVPHPFRWDGVRWRQVGRPCDGVLCWEYTDFVTWRKGQVLGLRRYQPDPRLLERRYEAGLDSAEGEEPMAGQRRVSLPDPRRALTRVRPGFVRLDPAPRGGVPQVAADLDPIAAAAVPGGPLYVLAMRGADSVVQTWRPDGDARGVINVLPGRPAPTVLRAVAGHVLVAGAHSDHSRGYLARYDGATWSEEPIPAGKRVCDVTQAASGALWAVLPADGEDCEAGSTGLWRREPTAPGWSRVEVPPLVFPGDTTWEYDDLFDAHEGSVAGAEPVAVQPRRVVARGDDVWFVVDAPMESSAVSAVLRTGAHGGGPLHLPSNRRQYTLLRDVPPFARPDAAGECPEGDPIFVRLRDLPSGTAVDAPSPEADELVRDHPELVRGLNGIYEFERDGRRFVGALIGNAVPPNGDALLQVLDRLVPGVRHAFECRLPPVRRKLYVRPSK